MPNNFCKDSVLNEVEHNEDFLSKSTSNGTGEKRSSFVVDENTSR